ncbi:MAG: xanthine and dehydrogenase maturation factor, XdhC/CoxF family [Verrucomicrobiales bacterium]|nr:xanthine and dehydrogenase maturation factor, XdhC/CoxF family [Verrucomicrobiales bacterium]
MKELLEICAALEELGDAPCALATVINVEGSAYRRPGARMLLTLEGDSWGMVSGGCLESDVMDHARRALQSGLPRVVRYDSTSDDDIVFGTGLGCNGIIDVLIEPVTEDLKEAFVTAVRACHKSREPGAVATMVGNGEESTCSNEHAFLKEGSWVGSEALAQVLNIHGVESSQTSLSNDYGETPVFIQQLLPPVHLVIFGGWLDVLPLIHMSKEVGFHVTVVDSRRRLSSRRLFREADAVFLCSPAEALSQIQVDDRTVGVVMNHHFERDQETLSSLSQYGLNYVGTLGPKRRLERMLNAWKATGAMISDEFVQTIHGPAGLDLGAKTPEEIALSIMGEILSVLNERNAKSLRERPTALAASA